MIQTTIKSLILLLIATALLSACEPRSAVSPGQPDISIAEAKAWAMGQHTTGRSAADDKKNYRTEYWNDAAKHTLSNGQAVVVVPLTYRYERVLAFWNEGYKKNKPLDPDNHFVQSKLLIYKDNRNAVQAYVIRVMPTELNRTEFKRVKGERFSGYVLAYNQNESQLWGGWTYNNGQETGWFRASGTKNGRVAETCYATIYTPVGDSPPAQVGGGGSSGRVYETINGTTYEVSRIEVPCSNNGGGGGGSPGSGGPNEPPTGGSPGSGGTGDNGSLESSAAYNFFYYMANNRGIYFDNDEKAVIQEYPQLIDKLRNYINQYGQKPDGSNAIIMSAADQQRYPKLAALIRSLPSFVEQTPKVQQALSQWSGFSINKIKQLLKFGTGPTLVIYDIRSQYGQETIGHCTCPGFPESRLEIDQSIVEEYERVTTSATEQALASFISIITLHEFVHYGAAMNGVNEKSAGMEFGREFERQLFGTIMNRANASQFTYKFFKQ